MTGPVRWFAALALMGAIAAQAAPPGQAQERTFEHDGVRVSVSLQPLSGQQLRQDGPARLRLTLRSALDDAPLAGADPGAWIDPADDAAPEGPACNRRVARYLGNAVTERAHADLAGYHVLLMNADASLSVLDPRTNFAGKSSLRTVLPLNAPGFDWDLHPRQHRLFVSLPTTRQLAVVDLASMTVASHQPMPGSPGRVRVQPDGRQVWVGVPQPAPRRSNTGVQPGLGGVQVLRADAPEQARWVATGDGHHEFAFDPDGWVAVTNRDSASISFVDPVSLLVQRTVKVDGVPIAAFFDARRRQFVVADARAGLLRRYDHLGESLDTLALAPGLGPLAVSPDGRWLLVLNPAAHKVHVVDLVGWAVRHALDVAGRPFQVEFAGPYAYVRALESEQVTSVQLASLAGSEPLLQRFAAGERRPVEAPGLPIAAQIAAMPDAAGVFALSPQDGAVYVYMQGMNAPMSSVVPRGHSPRAVRVARQGLLQVERGVFEAQVILPAHPRMLLAMANDRPRWRHCLDFALAPAERVDRRQPTRLDWRIDAGAPATARLEVAADASREWPQHLEVWAFRPGGGRQALQAVRSARRPEGAVVHHVYEVPLDGLSPGVHYLHLQGTPDGPVTPALAQRYASVQRPDPP